MKINDFIPKYNEKIPVYHYKEFLELKLDPTDLYKHQTFLSRYFGNIFMDSNELLMYHEMGSGKTCTAVSIIERLLKLYPKEYKGALVLTRGQGLIYNFIQEIAFKCTDKKYIMDQSEMSDKLYKTKIKRNIEEFYTFNTFEIFAKMLKDMSDNMIKTRFESFIIVIDEVHNIRDNENKTSVKIYDQIHRFLHLLEHRKIILMSGTPMKDNPCEIAGVMNLILPHNRQMATDNDFTNKYFFKEKLICIDELKNYFRGKVSFLKSNITDVPKVYIGSVISPLEHFKVIPLKMNKLQNDGYEIAWKLDKDNVNIYSNTRQASLFVDDNTHFGKNCIHTFRNLQNNSCKYNEVVNRLLEARKNGELSIVYSDIVRGSGLFTLAKCLESVGFVNSYKQPKSFVILTSNLTESQKQYYISVFNSYDNARGDLISVLLGSRVIMEGYTFKNVIHEHILTPHWNYAETSQLIARGWRIHSHDDLLLKLGLKPNLYIYQYVAIPKSLPSIDMIMYKISEQKDVAISQITRVIQESCIDCWLFKNKNKISGYDGERECQYLNCEYSCDSEMLSQDIIYTNQYDLYYFKLSKEWNIALELLKEIFKTNWVIKWEEFRKLFKYSEFQICQIIIYCKQNYIEFQNPRNSKSHLNYDSYGIFLTLLYDNSLPIHENYILCKYETTNIKPNYNEIVLADTMYYMEDTINEILKCTNDDNCINAINHLPDFIQEILLENALKAKAVGECNFLINAIHSHFKSSIFENDQYIGFKLNRLWCIEKNFLHQVSNDIIMQHFNSQKEKLENNPFGFYGQENRILNEFCIKIAKLSDEKDRRKIQSGRRCINWNKKDLVDLSHVLLGKNQWELLSRHETCAKLRNFFKNNNLMENDETCGTQHKRK